MLKARVAIQRDLEGLEEQANSKLMKFSKNNCKVQPLGRKNGWQRCRMGMDWWGSSSAQEILGAVANSEWHMSPVCPVGKKADGILGGINSSAACKLREMMIPFHSTLFRPH